MEKSESVPLGVVIERRRSDHRWSNDIWRPVAVFTGAPDLDPRGPWTRMREGEGWVQFHGGTLTLELFRAETEAYKVNLSQNPPRVFVLLRREDDPESAHDFVPFLVTASPYEAQDYLDSGEEIVEPVAMPEEVIAFTQAFIEAHHVEEVFTKRKRKKAAAGDDLFSPRPRVEPPPRPRRN